MKKLVILAALVIGLLLNFPDSPGLSGKILDR